MGRKGTGPERFGDRAAGNGILSRRIFLEGALVAGAAGVGVPGARAEPLTVAPWMKEPGTPFAAYGMPSRFESKVVRTVARPANPATPWVGTARTPIPYRANSSVMLLLKISLRQWLIFRV